ncbi:MAG: hypothetical protein METHAR1v1_470004 [Methanothrix sp.]|nr:MAG: hypothetical protein METHAR1v1_470004 [Methanothrix sp.]
MESPDPPTPDCYVTILTISIGEFHITIREGEGETGKDRQKRLESPSSALPGEDRSPGDSPGPPGRNSPGSQESFEYRCSIKIACIGVPKGSILRQSYSRLSLG